MIMSIVVHKHAPNLNHNFIKRRDVRKRDKSRTQLVIVDISEPGKSSAN